MTPLLRFLPLILPATAAASGRPAAAEGHGPSAGSQSGYQRVLAPLLATSALADDVGWNLHVSDHPDPAIAARQGLEWKELTQPRDRPQGSGVHADSTTGLTGGLLRVEPGNELALHWHPEPYGEVYYFTRGNGVVNLGAWTAAGAERRAHREQGAAEWRGSAGESEQPGSDLDAGVAPGDGASPGRDYYIQRRIAIAAGVHVNIPPGTLHGISTGSEGCEFVWMFPAHKWTDIPYLFADGRLADMNVGSGMAEQAGRAMRGHSAAGGREL